ncbi:MAG: hypothetical protein RLZZ623_3652, partial [Actinomycetota bacterium]
MERVTGIEPAFSAWEADVLPLNYTRIEGLRPTRRGKVSGRGRSLSQGLGIPLGESGIRMYPPASVAGPALTVRCRNAHDPAGAL